MSVPKSPSTDTVEEQCSCYSSLGEREQKYKSFLDGLEDVNWGDFLGAKGGNTVSGFDRGNTL
jgi:hypothetical protein